MFLSKMIIFGLKYRKEVWSVELINTNIYKYVANPSNIGYTMERWTLWQ